MISTTLILATILQSQVPALDVRVNTGAVEAPRQPDATSRTAFPDGAPTHAVPAGQPGAEFRSRIDRIAGVRGLEDNTISGVGLVVGLAGTGDSIDAAKKLLQNALLTRNVHVELQELESKNLAIVDVSAQLPAGLKPGRRIDVTVSAIGDSTSLVGGVLLFTELMDATGRTVYATASGPVTVGGFQASGQAGTAKKNQTTVGTLPGGGKVEREVETSIVSEHGLVHLDLFAEFDGLGNAVRIARAVNELQSGAAVALPDGRTVEVQVPSEVPPSEIVSFVHGILARQIEVDVVPRIVVNERTGTIVLGGNVRLRAGAIAHGSITVTIAESPVTSQPGPFSNGQTVVTPRTELDVAEEEGRLVMVPAAVTLRDVVEVLDVLGATPRELISILESMAQGGLLEAEIRRM
jgi:flagellar P-ring protein precursor FlgI